MSTDTTATTTCTFCHAVVDNDRPTKRAHAATHPDADQNLHGFKPTTTTLEDAARRLATAARDAAGNLRGAAALAPRVLDATAYRAKAAALDEAANELDAAITAHTINAIHAKLDATRPLTPRQRRIAAGLTTWAMWTVLAPLVVLLLVVLTGCGIAETDRHPAPRWMVADCKAALRLVVTDQGEIPAKPKACQNVSPGQYKGAVADVTRPYRIPEA